MKPRGGSADDVPTVGGAAGHSAAPSSRAPVLVALSEGRYTVLGLLGRGGQSVVHRAHDAAIGREVAIKEVLPAHAAGSESLEAIARFLREARVTGQLEHPGIVPVHEVGVKPDGTPYCVQKLVRGRTLAAALADCRDAASRLALLPHLLATCQAVAFAHGRGVIHRDLKPANVMVGEFGETVVLDWGLARVLGEAVDAPAGLAPDTGDAGLTLAGSGLGTPGHASPEQAAGHHERVDRRSDVYSLGVILQQLVSGPPGAAPSRDAPPRELAAIARRALAPDPAGRYASAVEMAADLEAFRDGRLVSAHAYGSWEMLRRLVRGHRTVATAVAVGLAALVIALVLISRAWAGARENLAEAFTQQANSAAAARDWPVAEASHAMAARLRDSPAARWGAALAASGDPVAGIAWQAHDGQLNAIAVSQDGALLVTAAAAEAALWRLDSGALVAALVGHDVHVTSAAFDADGVAWTADERGLVLGWDSAGREVARHATGVEAIRDMSSAPGALLLSVGGDAAMRLDTRLGTVERIAHAPPGVAWEMASPRGDRVLSIGQGDTIALRVAGEAPGPPRPGGHAHGIIGAVFSPDGSLFATSAADRVVILRTWPDGAERARLVGHSGAVGRGAFTPDGSLLATPSHDGVLLWSTRLGRLQARFTAGLDLHRLTFTPDGRTLVTASGRGAVRTWRIPDWSRHVVADDDMPVRVVAFDATGRLLVAGSRGGLVRVIRVSDGAEVARVHAHDDTAGVNDISIHPSGRLLATAGNEGTVATWTLPGLEPLGRTSPGEREAFCVAWSPDGESLWSGWASGVVLRHDRTLRGPLARVQAHRQGAINLELSDDGGTFVTSSRDRTAKVWDARTLALRHELRVQGAALAADLSPDGLTVATGSDMGRVTIWDARTGLPLSELAGHEHWVVQVAFRPDGRVLASVGLDALRIWDVRSGGQLASTDAVALSVAWSADGSWLATGDLRGAIHFQPIADPASAADVEAILARRRLRRDGMALRDVPP